MVASAIGEYGGIENFPTGTALPGFEGTNEIIVLLSVHPAFALGTFHSCYPLINVIAKSLKGSNWYLHKACQLFKN